VLSLGGQEVQTGAERKGGSREFTFCILCPEKHRRRSRWTDLRKDDMVLTQLKAAHVVSASPAGVRTALDAAVSAAAAAKVSVWLHDFGNMNDLPTQKLRAIRMGPDDIQAFGLFPVDQSAGPPGRSSGF